MKDCKHSAFWASGPFEKTAAWWAEGVSATQIAKRLSAELGCRVTRNAVMGKLNRAGLIGTRRAAGVPNRGPKPSKPKRAAAPPTIRPKKFVAKPFAQRCVEVESRPVSFVDRERHQCAWLLDGGLCCGARTARGSYCEGHANLGTKGQGKPLNENLYASLGNRAAAVRQPVRMTGWGDAA